MSIYSQALFLSFLLAVSVAAQNTLTSPVDVARAAATARTNSPTSNVKGKAFDRIAIIWLENTDYAKAVGDRKLYISNFYDLKYINIWVEAQQTKRLNCQQI